MATEASVTDQAADEHVEEMKVGDDIKHVDEESVSQPKDLEGKCEEEKLKVEDSTITEDEVRPEVDTLVDDLKKEEAQEGDVIEKEPEPEAVEKPVENMEESSVQKLEYEATLETATKELKTEELPDLSAAPSSASEIPDLSTAVEPVPDIAGDPDTSGSAEILQDGKTSAEDVEHVEETKVGDDIKRVNEENVSQPKDLEGKYDEEKLKVEDSANLEASVTEHEPESEAADEVIEKEPESDSLLEPTDEVIEKEPESKAVEKPSENMEASSEQESEYEAAKEPVVLETTEEVKTEEFPDLSIAPISASETEEKATEPVEPTSDVAVDPASAEIPQDEKTLDVEVELSPESSNKTSDAIAVDPAQVSELNGDGPDVTEKTKANPDPEIGGGEKELLESVEVEEKDIEEGPTLSEKVAAATEVAEVPSEGGGFEKVEEKEAGSLDTATKVDKTSLVETSNDLDAATERLEGATSRDLDVDSTAAEEADDAEDGTGTKTEGEAAKDRDATTDVAEVSTDKLVNEDSADKKDEVDDAKDGTGTKTEGVAPENQVTVKTSQRQSNSIMSKVKQSIVKVKKAIIGKSKSSKTMSSESKDDP